MLLFCGKKRKKDFVMTNQERYNEYIEEYCKDCKNRKDDLCNIKIISYDGVITTKCVYYERENKL